MEYLYTFLLVAVVAILLIGLIQSRAATVRTFYNRNYPLGAPSIVENPIDPNNPINPTREFFGNPDTSTDAAQSAGSSRLYRWGMPSDEDIKKDDRSCTVAAKCPDVGPCRESDTANQAVCDSCDILKHKDIKYFTLKSSIPSCPDMSEYVKKSEVPAMPDMKEYIKKSEIPACDKCPDMNEYVHKSAIPSNPECPKCPVCPVCPVCPESYDRIEQDPRFARAFANADIRKHPDIAKFISKSEAQAAMQKALELQAKDLLKNLRCPTDNVKPEQRRQSIEVRQPNADYDFVFQRPQVSDKDNGIMSSLQQGVSDIMGSLFSRESKMKSDLEREAELDRRALQNIPLPAGNNNKNQLRKMELPAAGNPNIWTDSVLPSQKCDV